MVFCLKIAQEITPDDLFDSSRALQKKKAEKKRRNAPSPVLLSPHSCALTSKVLTSYEKITWIYALIWPVKDITTRPTVVLLQLYI